MASGSDEADVGLAALLRDVDDLPDDAFAAAIAHATGPEATIADVSLIPSDEGFEGADDADDSEIVEDDQDSDVADLVGYHDADQAADDGIAAPDDQD